MLRIFDYLESHDLWNPFIITDTYKILPPVPQTGKIICLGRNYAAHAKESGSEVPTEPILFVKTKSTVIGQEEKILLPKDVGRVDHEIELAVVIGKRAAQVSRAAAFEFIAGFTILNDVTARAMQKQDIDARKPWYRSKNFDTFGPMGPCLVTSKEIGRPIELDLTLRVNGEIRQHSNTRNMIFDIPTLIEYISQWITLEPGDLISTGTPEGISELHPGDIVEAEIEKIGILRNFVASRDQIGRPHESGA
ncbi:MAG: fumarylacetoacetate hydrolase family protein [Calditrichaeota bacterium]|nr:fumarylacetoacetate hydrolase family protein [Calditrichota bacterium]